MKNKKILYIAIAAIVVIAVVLAIVFAGGNNKDNNNTTTTTTTQKPVELAYKDSLELLNKVLTSYNASAAEEAMLYVAGGNPDNFDTVSFDSPAKFVALEDSSYNFHLGYPESELPKLEDASSMYNMMNANIFNCYALKLTSTTDVNALADTLKNNILARQWVCGMPEKLIIVSCPGNYLVVIWGVVADGGIVVPVADSIVANIEGASIIVDVAIAE